MFRLTYVWIEWHFAQKRNLQVLAHGLCTSSCGREDLRLFLALGADEATHVLYHTNDGQLHLVAEADLFPDILEGHLLAKFTEQLSLSQRALKDTCEPGGVVQSSECSLT